MDSEQVRSWSDVLILTYDQLIQQLVVFAPKLLGAFLLIVIGGLVAFLLSKAARTGVSLLERFLVRVIPSVFQSSDIKLRLSYLNVISKVIFWLVFLFFIAASANSLGLAVVSGWVGDLLRYLPRLVIGLLIIIGGYFISNVCNLMAISAAESAGLKEAHWIGRGVQGAVFFTAIVIGIEQLGINIQFFTQFFIVVSAIILGGFSLAFALGAKQLVANIIGAQQASKLLRLGDDIRMTTSDGVMTEGVLVEISGTMLIIETHQGRVIIPARLFLEHGGQLQSNTDSSGD